MYHCPVIPIVSFIEWMCVEYVFFIPVRTLIGIQLFYKVNLTKANYAVKLLTHPLGCLFLFSGILFLDPKNPFLPGFRCLFFSCFIFSEKFLHRDVVLEGLENSCFQPFSQEFFTGIPAGQEFLYLHRIPMDSSGFLQIPPDSCSRLKLSGFSQRLKNALC